MKNFISNMKTLMERDWLDKICGFYKNINPVYRHSFWILFVITNIVFGFHTINFLWGNHDWFPMNTGAYLKAGFWEGRYGAFAISYILTGKLYLPIISALWAFAALSLSAVLLAIYWKLPQKVSNFVILGLILNITPYALVWLWYAHCTINIFFGRLFIIASFVLVDKYWNGTVKQKILSNLSAVLLLSFGIGIYQSYIETFTMVLVGRFLIEITEWDAFKKEIVAFSKRSKYTVINVVWAIILYQIIYKWLKFRGYIHEGFYNMQTISLQEIPDKAVLCIKSAWQQFTDFSMPFYPDILTKLFFILAVIFVVQVLLSRKSLFIKLLICATFVASLFLTKVVALISPVKLAMYSARIEFCGYVFFNALIVALCLKTGGILKNIKILICCLIIYIFAINDLYQQRTWYFGMEAEKMILNRIQSRIENQGFQNNSYFLQLGDWKSERANFYYANGNKNINNYEDSDLLKYSFTPRWMPHIALSFYNHLNLKKVFICNDFKNPEFMSALRRVYDAGLLDDAHAWPAQNSIIVYEDIILVIMGEEDLQIAKSLLSENSNDVE